MKRLIRLTSVWNFLRVLSLGWSVILSIPMKAQDNAVYDSSGTTTVHSTAFIDASAVVASGDTFCSVIYKILNSVSYSAAVVDARGLPGSTPPTNMTCAAGWTPWNNGMAFVNKPSTILLPVGVITTSSATWVVPGNTRLIGVGSSTSGGTIIRAANPFSGAVIQLGGPTCTGSSKTGIAVEDLVIDGQAQIITGLVNQCAGSLSYVNNVTLYQILGTGLQLTTNAGGSGPYSNITFDPGNHNANNSTVCAQVNASGGLAHAFTTHKSGCPALLAFFARGRGF